MGIPASIARSDQPALNILHRNGEPPYKQAPVPSYANRKTHPERLRALQEHADSTILDAGCGNGAYIFELAGRYDIMGIDHQEFENWKACPERFAVGDVCNLPHPPESVQTIASFEVLEHVPDPEQVLRDFHRICRKNIIISVPNCAITAGMRSSLLAHYHWVDPTHVNFFTLDTITQLCRDAGFRNVTGKYMNRMNPLPLVEEGFALKGVVGWLLRSLLARRQHHPYYLNCLVIAEK